ncbi:MAG: hypothetical protein LH606_11355 [Cytophagaceae bacterium]|nr:hypothetical protein [Cytophagaceae bacterium]
MKKLLTFLALTVLVALASTGKTSAQAYENGRNYLNVGIGLGTYGGGGLGFGGSFEHGFTDAISAGAIVGYSSGNYGYIGSDYRFTFLNFGVRGSYHFAELLNIGNNKLDPYAGLGLGYRVYGDNFSGTGYNRAYGSGIFFMGHVGARYFFSDNVGGYAELGAGFATLQLGITLKF